MIQRTPRADGFQRLEKRYQESVVRLENLLEAYVSACDSGASPELLESQRKVLQFERDRASSMHQQLLTMRLELAGSMDRASARASALSL
jgi:hypothetical protein